MCSMDLIHNFSFADCEVETVHNASKAFSKTTSLEFVMLKMGHYGCIMINCWLSPHITTVVTLNVLLQRLDIVHAPFG